MEIDRERQHKARIYARQRRVLFLLSMSIGGLGVLIIIFTGLGTWLRDTLQNASAETFILGWQPLTGWYPLHTFIFFALLTSGYTLLTAPIAYYSGYVLSHRYGLSTQSLKSWLADRGKGLALSFVFEALLILMIYALLAIAPQTWWLWVALALLFFSVILANLAPILLFPLFYKFVPLPDGELTRRLLALAQQANTHVRGVFLMKLSEKTTAANAALMGLGNTRRIVLGDTLVDRYTPDEIEVVLAHELGHHVHHDIWKLLGIQSALTLGGLFLYNLVLHWIVDVQGYYQSLTDPAALPLLFLLAGIASFLVMPLSNGLSRAIEYQADEYALQATGKVEAFKSAMTRLANQNLADVDPAPWIEFFFYSHPAISKRLKHADDFATRT